MNALLVYPKCPDTFWSFKHALKFISKRATYPPLGLLTVASMLPEEWNKRLVDMNVSSLRRRDLKWADIVFISAMTIQQKSVRNIIKRCKQAGVRIVAGGPLFTTEHEAFDEVDHFVLNEAESTLPAFLADLERGSPRRIYASDSFKELAETPLPMWDLIDPRKYASMNIQYSRGCPFDCEFCDIPLLYGRKVRTKSSSQLQAELQAIYDRGHRGDIFFVDDNFIGSRKKLKQEILPSIIEWLDEHGRPYEFITEASIDLCDDSELMRLMSDAGFTTVFVGIETTHEESLAECNKGQNRRRDLMASVRTIQDAGLQVTGGFIVGFDNDPPTIFEGLISFIQQSGIVTAMVGLLNAPRGTKLWDRLKREGRLISNFSGDNTGLITNFVPQMGMSQLTTGYKRIIKELYSPAPYYKRVIAFIRRFRPRYRKPRNIKPYHIGALVKSVFRMGLFERERLLFWKLFFWTAFKRSELFPMAITFAIYGRHFRTVFKKYL